MAKGTRQKLSGHRRNGYGSLPRLASTKPKLKRAGTTGVNARAAGRRVMKHHKPIYTGASASATQLPHPSTYVASPPAAPMVAGGNRGDAGARSLARDTTGRASMPSFGRLLVGKPVTFSPWAQQQPSMLLPRAKGTDKSYAGQRSSVKTGGKRTVGKSTVRRRGRK